MVERAEEYGRAVYLEDVVLNASHHINTTHNFLEKNNLAPSYTNQCDKEGCARRGLYMDWVVD